MSQVQNGVRVRVGYTLRYDGPEGEIIEETRDNEPLDFIYGKGEMLPKFEEAMHGLSESATFTVKILAEDAYGEEREELYREFAKSEFIADGEWDEEMFQEGMVVPMQTPDGQVIEGIIAEVKLNSVVLDFNHPLAGEDLYFEGTVLKIGE
ncbi:MAG: hypothetical protein RL220_1010 [Bacteroidota bacterium]|jgi:FKBP-type peptidyl-prolyl cis-trans isomerase SlyD